MAVLPWLYDGRAVALAVIGVFAFGQGINLGYHRLLTHRSLKLPRWLERCFVLLAICCLQESPATWVAWHRAHHAHSDRDRDPHSPLISFLWGHMAWLAYPRDVDGVLGGYRRYAQDILQDPFYRRLEHQPVLIYLIYLAHAALFFAAGFGLGWAEGGSAASGLRLGLSFFVWAVVLRTVAVWHITWSVNSLTHLFGYRSHDTDDNSRNNWLVGLIAVGEGWHNNHHHDQASATTQHRWWELDFTYYLIRLLETLGLATEVVRPRHKRRAAAISGEAPR
ncbi:MAG: acyl-CoA desaturase [Candidatus Eiseniibacteriota bacterium]